MNKRGFSLIELLATLVILGTVMGIATYSIISILNNSKEKNYSLILEEEQKYTIKSVNTQKKQY